ncbi:MAG TPA: VOC family protein [Paenibacillus sp.]|nr:VOC family protein [Paenibacillus sp.]
MPKNPHFISQLGHVELYSPKVDDTVAFFKDVIGLEESGRDGKSVYFRAWGEFHHHSLKITDHTTNGLGHISWRADSAEALEEAAKYIESTGLGRGWIEGDLGHGKAYQFESPDGHLEEIFWDVDLYQAPDELKSVWRNRPQRNPGRGIAPRRLDHVTLHSTDVTKCREFYQGLGFYHREGILLDEPINKEIGAWFSVTNLSHDIALLGEQSGKRGLLNHVCYAVESREEVLIAADHIIESGYTLEMGAPTRHKIAEGFFFYVNEPGGNRFELYSGAHLIFAPDFGPYMWRLSENPNDAWGNVMPWEKDGKIIK